MASSVSPEGYVYGSTPVPNVPFWDNSMDFTDITATADVDNTSGQPSVDLEVTKNNVGVGNLEFHFHGLKGQSGDSGNVEADATIDANTGTPSVTVEKTYIDEETTKFTFNFKNLKGANGEQGADGADGTDGITPVISATATVDNTSSDTPTCTVTKSGTDAAPSFEFAFHGIKGASGGGSFDLSNIPDLDNQVLSQISSPTKGTAETFDPTTVQTVDAASAILGETATVQALLNGKITLNGTFDVSTDGITYTEQQLTNFKLEDALVSNTVNVALSIHTTQMASSSNFAFYHPISATRGYCCFKSNFLRINVKNNSGNAPEIVLEGYDEDHEHKYYIKCKLLLDYNSYLVGDRTTAFGGSISGFNITKDTQTGSIVLSTSNIYILDKNNDDTYLSADNVNIIVPITFSLRKIPLTLRNNPSVASISTRTNITYEEIYSHIATKYGVTFPS